jgi:hypothetical protein
MELTIDKTLSSLWLYLFAKQLSSRFPCEPGRTIVMRVSVPFCLFVYLLIGGACWVPTALSGTTDNTQLEVTVRALVRANFEKDLPAMSKLMAHDANIVSYSIGGRKYVSWPDLERDIKEEFANVAASDAMPVDDRTSAVAPRTLASSTGQPTVLDLSGEWDVPEVEDDKRYQATLDKTGNGPYSP